MDSDIRDALKTYKEIGNPLFKLLGKFSGSSAYRIAAGVTELVLILVKLLVILAKNALRLVAVLAHPLGWVAVAAVIGAYLLVRIVLPMLNNMGIDKSTRRVLALFALLLFAGGLLGIIHLS